MIQVALLLFATGLTAGFGYCAGMCGGLVGACSFAACSAGHERSSPALFQAFFHAGRLAAYAAFGALLGGIGALPELLAAARPIQAWLQLFAALLMIAAGIAIGAAFAPLSQAPRLPIDMTRRAMATVIKAGGAASGVPLGFLVGLLPCGMTVAIGLKALASGSALGGVGVMLAFGAGTVPALLGFGLVSGLFGSKANAFALRVGALLVVGVGLLTLLQAGTHLRWW